MEPQIIVIISSDVEWSIVCGIFKEAILQDTPFGHWFLIKYPINDISYRVIFCRGGWGKISAAASTQYFIDKWEPVLLVNLGTCGGFAGYIESGAILLVDRTLVYDILDQMDNSEESLAHYATDIDLSWLTEPFPQKVRRSRMVSGDRDLLPQDIEWLHQKYGAVAGDWESGSIAWVAGRNHIRLLILRGVSDLVSVRGGEAYQGNSAVFKDNARIILTGLIQNLPDWLSRIRLFS